MRTIFERTRDTKPVWEDSFEDDPDIDLDNGYPRSPFPATVGGSDDIHQQSCTSEQPSQLVSEPPVTKATLSMLDTSKIFDSPKLRCDMNFDPDLYVRPNLDGEKGRMKAKRAEDFWDMRKKTTPNLQPASDLPSGSTSLQSPSAGTKFACPANVESSHSFVLTEEQTPKPGVVCKVDEGLFTTDNQFITHQRNDSSVLDPPLPSHTKTLLEIARHIKGMHIRSTKSFTNQKKCVEAEIRFTVLTDKEVTKASIGDIFDPAYDPNQWMLYADFRNRFDRVMTLEIALLDWPDTVEDWLEKKLSMSEEELAANNLFVTSESNAHPKEPLKLKDLQAAFEGTANHIHTSQDHLSSKTTTVQNMTQYGHHDLDLDLKTRPFLPSHHPVVETYLFRLGDLTLLKERLDETLDERRYLIDELEVRMKHGLSLGAEKQNFLDKSGLLLSGIRKQIAILEVEVDMMKEECLARHLLDENGDPITMGDGESSKYTIFPSSHSAIDTSRHNSDTWAKIIRMKADFWGLRSKVRETRRLLREKRLAKSKAEDDFLQHVSKHATGTGSSMVFSTQLTEVLLRNCENARNDYDPVEHDLNHLESDFENQTGRLLDEEYWVVAQLQKSPLSADLLTTNTSTAKTEHHKAHSNGRRGVKGVVNGKDIWAFCDTGAGQNVIAARHAKQMGLKMKHRPKLLRMGNSNQVLSPGVVRYPWAFSDDPLNVTTIIAHVLDDFKYDCLLGNPFLRFSQLMTKHIHRFVKGVFPSSNVWSLNILGETSHRVHGMLGNSIVMEGLPDIGSSRNVMDAVWAKSAGFAIRSSPEHCGVIIFPDNSIRATIGQVHTTVTLPDGEVTPIIFEVLPDCYVPVVLGEDFVFDNNLFMNHAEAICEAEGIDSSQDLLCMDYQQQSFFAKIGSRAQVLLGPKEKRKERHDRKRENNPLNDTAELKRQQEWDSKYQHGQTASRDEWDAEQKRRTGHEQRQYPNWRPNSQKSLIKFRPILDDHGRSTSTSSGTLFEPGDEPATSSIRRSDPQEPPAFDEDGSSGVMPMTSSYSSPSFASFGFEEAALWGED